MHVTIPNFVQGLDNRTVSFQNSLILATFLVFIEIFVFIFFKYDR
jgi:hypothetical protein